MSSTGTTDRLFSQFQQQYLLWIAPFYPDLQVCLHYRHQLQFYACFPTQRLPSILKIILKKSIIDCQLLHKQAIHYYCTHKSSTPCIESRKHCNSTRSMSAIDMAEMYLNIANSLSQKMHSHTSLGIA